MRTTESFKLARGKGSERKLHEYQVNMWHPDKAMLNLAWLIQMVGEPVITILMKADTLSELMEKVDTEVLVPAVRSLVTQINGKEFVEKVNSFTEDMLCDGVKVDYKIHFMGYPGHLVKVVYYVLKAQYADFFDDPLEALSPEQ